MTYLKRNLVPLVVILSSLIGCDSIGVDPDDGAIPDAGAADAGGFPRANDWSWNSSWTPSEPDFPLAGLFDDEYGDGHEGTPVLPPGNWDWSDADNDLANWNNYQRGLGAFEPLMDSTSRQYGWRFVRVSDAVEYKDAAVYFEGSSGVDYLHLGRHGSIVGFTQGNLGEGPDVLIFDAGDRVEFRTGTTTDGGARDDDLVMAGCNPNVDGAFDIVATQLHTGPGSDWVFARDLMNSAIDLGNRDGLTDTLDALDAGDLAVVRGNSSEVRIFGGGGDDVFVWYVDDNAYVGAPLGARFFGGGGWGDALFADNGNDRLVLAIPADTEMVDTSPPGPGALSLRSSDGGFVLDDATEHFERARHCIECGMSPSGGLRTVILEYRSADGAIDSGPVYLTSVEELQIGVGEGARVFALDGMSGTATLLEDATAFDAPEPPADLCD
jgi:hypothetical protein